jgi:hypothetical protein
MRPHESATAVTILGSSPEAYAFTLTEDEMRDLRDALSASISTVTRSEIDVASRRAHLMMKSTLLSTRCKPTQ